MDAVIVTYNSASDLREQLACDPLRASFDRIIVVDNDSSDESVDVARAAGVEVVSRGVNDSLAAAVNEGFRHAGSEHVALLNPDVLLDDESIVPQLEARFRDDRRLGLVAPTLVLPDGSRQDSAREIPTPMELVKRRLSGAELGAVHPSALADVPWVVSAFVVVRHSTFDEVGGFDEDFRLYFEDVDFCVRLWQRGWRVRLDPAVVARHEHRASSRQTLLGWAMRQHIRSAAHFFRKHPELLFARRRGALSLRTDTATTSRPRRVSHPAPRAVHPAGTPKPGVMTGAGHDGSA